MDEIIEKLNEMGKLGKVIKDRILIKAAKPMLDDMISTKAFKDTTGINGGRGRKGLAIAKPKTKGGIEYVLIGIDKASISEIFYMKFLEWGTSKMPAKPFMTPAYYKHKDEAFAIMKSELKNEMKL